MAKKSVIKQLNDFTSKVKSILSTPAGKYAPDWDDPKTQYDRVLKKSDQPLRLEVGNPGIVRRGP